MAQPAPPAEFVARRPMLDVIFLIAGTAFFFLTAAYADGCDRL